MAKPKAKKNSMESLFQDKELAPEFAKELKNLFEEAVQCKMQEMRDEMVEADEDPEANTPPASEAEVKSVADAFYTSVDELTKDQDIRRILKSADIDVASFTRMLKATAGDLEGNKLAEPMIGLLSGIFQAIANDSTVSARIAQMIEKGGSAPEGEVPVEEEASTDDDDEDDGSRMAIKKGGKVIYTFPADMRDDDPEMESIIMKYGKKYKNFDIVLMDGGEEEVLSTYPDDYGNLEEASVEEGTYKVGADASITATPPSPLEMDGLVRSLKFAPFTPEDEETYGGVESPDAEIAYAKIPCAIIKDGDKYEIIVGFEDVEVMEQNVPESVTESLINNVDVYLSYLAEQWLEQNKLEIENGIKVELAEQFLGELKGFYKKHNVKNIPTADLTQNLEKKVKIAENKLNEQIENNAKLLAEHKQVMKSKLLLEATIGLTDTQKEKLQKLAAGVTYESSEDFNKQLATLKESVLTNKVIKKDTKLEGSVVLTENEEKLDRMKLYRDIISSGKKW